MQVARTLRRLDDASRCLPAGHPLGPVRAHHDGGRWPATQIFAPKIEPDALSEPPEPLKLLDRPFNR